MQRTTSLEFQLKCTLRGFHCCKGVINLGNAQEYGGIFSEGVNWGNVQICAFFVLRNRPFRAPSSDWNHFCFEWKLALWAARGWTYIHVSHSVSNSTGVQAHPDHQNPDDAAFYEKTTHIRVYHQPLHRLTPFLLQLYLFVTRSPYHLKSCNLVEWVNSCEDFGVQAVGN